MPRVSPDPLESSSVNKKTIVSKLAFVTELLKSITTGQSSKGEKFDSIEPSLSSDATTPDGMGVQSNYKRITRSFFNRVFGGSRRVTPYKTDHEAEPSEGGTTPRSNAASDASAASTVKAAISIGSESPREGPRELPGTIDDIFNEGIDQYLNNIQDSWFGDPHKSSDNGADSREKYWQFLEYIITLPLYIKKSEVGKPGGSMSNDNITTENTNPDGMEEIRTGYIRDTLTKILSENSCIELNEFDNPYIKLNEFDEPHIKVLVEQAMTSNMSDVLVELVKVLDRDGIQLFFKKCTEYLSQNNALQKKETLKKALDLLLDDNGQMKLQWKDVDRWNKFKDECIKLSTDFYDKEYVKASKDIDERLKYIQTDKEKNEAESQKETKGFTPIYSPGAFTLLRLIHEKKFDPIKTELNAIGNKSNSIRDKKNSAVSKGLVYQIYNDLDQDKFKSLVKHLRLNPKGDGSS